MSAHRFVMKFKLYMSIWHQRTICITLPNVTLPAVTPKEEADITE